MSLTHPNDVVTEQRLSEFYRAILPYLHGDNTSIVYGMRITRGESSPAAKIEYLGAAYGKQPAAMNFTTGEFDYGGWYDAFFLPRPCMLGYDGIVDYYLDPNDYTKKEDGTASDIANTSYEGNAMMEWGQNGKKIWLRIEPDSNYDDKTVCIYIADRNVNGMFTDWNFHNHEGKKVDHFYTAIYNGSLINGKIRSLSGQQVSSGLTCQQEMDYATANNPAGSSIWNIETLADIDLINILLMLISKSTNTQAIFGQGLNDGGTESINNSFVTGEHDDKGMFYGTNSGDASIYSNAVKVFGMENWWGFAWRRYLGEVVIDGVRKRKLTYGTEDGTTATGYNVTGEGYTECDVDTPSGTSGSYISEVIFSRKGLFPTVASGSATTHYCDGLTFSNSGTYIPLRGGVSNGTNTVGTFNTNYSSTATESGWNTTVALSAKPPIQLNS